MGADPTADAGAGSDRLWRFVFERCPVRGALVQIGSGWQELLQHRDYPGLVRQLLGEALAAAPLLGSGLKFEGRLSLQIESEGPVSLLLVQLDDQLELRGMARHAALPADAGQAELLGGGRLALTLEPSGQGQRYQAVVPLDGRQLGDCLAGYFQRSEQIPTQLHLAADDARLGGLLLQRLPAAGMDAAAEAEDWQRLQLLTATLGTDELLQLPAPEILRRLYHAEALRLFEPQPVSLRCRCSHGRISELLLNLGRAEVQGILAEQDQVEIECSFCGRRYRYRGPEIEQLFRAAQAEPGSGRRH